MKKKTTLTLLIVCLLAFAFLIGSFIGKEQARPTITSDLIENRIEKVKELVTLDYHYTNMGQFENHNTFYGWRVPFTEKKFIVSYNGLIKAGVDLSDMQVRLKENSILITLPPAHIISHEIDEYSIKVFDEKSSVFNPILISDYKTFSQDQKKEVETQAVQRGLIQQAQKRSEEAIREILLTDKALENYRIEFQTREN